MKNLQQDTIDAIDNLITQISTLTTEQRETQSKINTLETELRKVNFHLSNMTDNVVKDEDI